MRFLLIVSTLFLLSGCTVKYTKVEICPEVAESGRMDLYIDTTGSHLTTATDQKADGALQLEIPLEGVL